MLRKITCLFGLIPFLIIVISMKPQNPNWEPGTGWFWTGIGWNWNQLELDLGIFLFFNHISYFLSLRVFRAIFSHIWRLKNLNIFGHIWYFFLFWQFFAIIFCLFAFFAYMVIFYIFVHFLLRIYPKIRFYTTLFQKIHPKIRSYMDFWKSTSKIWIYKEN